MVYVSWDQIVTRLQNTPSINAWQVFEADKKTILAECLDKPKDILQSELFDFVNGCTGNFVQIKLIENYTATGRNAGFFLTYKLLQSVQSFSGASGAYSQDYVLLVRENEQLKATVQSLLSCVPLHKLYLKH